MAETILLLVLICGLILFLLYIAIKENSLPKKTIILSSLIAGFSVVILFLHIGADKVESDIFRVIHNSRPKKVDEVYSLLFKKSIDGCVTFINFKDQVIPKIDCCIWMELKLCTGELNRIIALKKYQKSRLDSSDSTSFLNSFIGRPSWWTPQILGDSLTKYNIKFSQEKEQTVFFGDDSSHIFVCDQAL